MKVRDLIAALQSQDPDSEVHVEGCDCVEAAAQVHSQNGFVLIGRADEYDYASYMDGVFTKKSKSHVAQGWFGGTYWPCRDGEADA